MKIRRGRASDAKTIEAFDAIAQRDASRATFIRTSIASDTCLVAEVDERVVAYGVLDYRFYDQGFVAMLYVHRDFRRRGIGSRLLSHMERHSRTGKLFTSTNRSNRTMQALLGKTGYQPSGFIENLNEGDPELVYVKYLEPGTV